MPPADEAGEADDAAIDNGIAGAPEVLAAAIIAICPLAMGIDTGMPLQSNPIVVWMCRGLLINWFAISTN